MDSSYILTLVFKNTQISPPCVRFFGADPPPDFGRAPRRRESGRGGAADRSLSAEAALRSTSPGSALPLCHQLRVRAGKAGLAPGRSSLRGHRLTGFWFGHDLREQSTAEVDSDFYAGMRLTSTGSSLCWNQPSTGRAHIWRRAEPSGPLLSTGQYTTRGGP